MSIETQDLAARYGAAWAAHDLDAIMAMSTPTTRCSTSTEAGNQPLDSVRHARRLPPRSP